MERLSLLAASKGSRDPCRRSPRASWQRRTLDRLPTMRQPEGAIRAAGASESWPIESPHGGEIFILANPAGLHGRRSPTIALWCAVETVRTDPSRQLAQEPRSVQRRPSCRLWVRSARLRPPGRVRAWPRGRAPASREGPVGEGWGCRDPALRASRSTAWSSANVTTAGSKSAGNKLRLRAAGIGHDEGGGRVARGATTGWRRGTGERPPTQLGVGGSEASRATGRPGHSSCVFLRDPVKYI
jgi:hypothetical protein